MDNFAANIVLFWFHLMEATSETEWQPSHNGKGRLSYNN